MKTMPRGVVLSVEVWISRSLLLGNRIVYWAQYHLLVHEPLGIKDIIWLRGWLAICYFRFALWMLYRNGYQEEDIWPVAIVPAPKSKNNKPSALRKIWNFFDYQTQVSFKNVVLGTVIGIFLLASVFAIIVIFGAFMQFSS